MSVWRLLYWSSLGASVVAFAWYAITHLRRAILVAMILTTFTLGALPSHLLPFDGFGFGVQVGVCVLAASWFALRRDASGATPYILSPYVLAVLALGLLCVIYLWPTSRPAYGLSKSEWFLAKGLLPLVLLCALAPFDGGDARLIFWTIVAGALLTALDLLAFGRLSGERRLVGDLNPITVARPVGMGTALLLCYLGLRGSKRLGEGVLCFLGVVVLLFAILQTGARGPLIAALLAPAGVVLLTRSNWKVRLLGSAAAVVVAAGLIVAINLAPQPSAAPQGGIQRIISQISTLGSNSSDQKRIVRFKLAWDGFLDSYGLGVGTGGFAAMYWSASGREYPHNVLLEVAVEQGVLGLAALAAVLAIPFRSLLQIAGSPAHDAFAKALLALWVFAFLNALVSMDIVGNYALWVSGGVVWALGRGSSDAPTATEAETPCPR